MNQKDQVTTMQVVNASTGEREEVPSEDELLKRFDELHSAMRVINDFDAGGALGSARVFFLIAKAADSVVDQLQAASEGERKALQADADEREEVEDLLDAIDNGLLDEEPIATPEDDTTPEQYAADLHADAAAHEQEGRW